MSEEETVQTKSAKKDYIKNFLEGDKQSRKIIESFIPRPGGEFPINPLADDHLFGYFNEDPDEFKLLVKAAVLQIIEAWGGTAKAEAAKQYLLVQVVDSNEIKMHDWDAEYEGKPVAVRCQIISALSEETYTKKAMVYCPACHRSQSIENLNQVPNCPNKDCENYRTRMAIAKASLKTGPIRTVFIQEPMDETRHGFPKILPCVIKDNDVRKLTLGPKKIIGVFRSEPQKYKSTNKIIINAISVHSLDDEKPLEPTRKQQEEMEQMVKRDDFISTIQDSFAPEVRYGGTELAKLCIILSILGGVPVGRIRGFVHALILGDPSTAKSKMLEFIKYVVKKSGFAVGGTSSGSGVTITQERLPNGTKIPRIGLIPQCSGGCAAIDEMNQLETEDLGKMFEGMESGRIHYEKGGVKVDADAQTAIQGGANPRGYYYDWTKTIMDNIHMPGPLIQRFDLKVNLLDNQNSTEEDRIRDHISLIRNIGIEKYIEQNNLLTPDELMLFFDYAKTFKPKMTAQADRLLKDFDKTLREIEQPKGAPRVDRRFYESIGRITLAWAKLHLSEEATADHAMSVIEIYKRAMKTFRMNVDAGEMQFSMEDTRHTKETAFVFAFREEQSSQEATYIQEVPLLERLTKNYPKLFSTMDKAEAYFEAKRKEGKLVKREGRYNLE